MAQLRDSDTGCRIRALSRFPQSANLPHDIEVVQGDLSVPDTLDHCLEGVDSVFLVWVAPFVSAAAVIERIASHAERIVLLSSPHRTPHPFFQQPNALRSVHAGIEQLIETSGVRWTFLRPGAFAINCRNWWAPQIRRGDVVRWFYAAAATAPIHERDVAAVAVRALADEGHSGREYVLTGPESLSHAAQVRAIGDAIGRALRFDELSPDEFRRETAGTWPASVTEMLLSAWRARPGTRCSALMPSSSRSRCL